MPSEPLTSVHPFETNGYVPERTTEEFDTQRATDRDCLFRHAGWTVQRARVREALELVRVRPRRLLAFDLCGCGAWLMVDKADDTRVRVGVSTCRNRWCIPCAKGRSYIMAENLRRKLAQTTCRKLELTLKSTSEPLQRQIDRLWDSFKSLRKTDLWRTNILGGAAVFETTWNSDTGQWHPHLHVVMTGNWIDKRDIQALWWRITGDSYIVHIRLIGSASDAAKYVTKYIAKPSPALASMPIPVLAELITAYHGRRLITTFGDWRGFRLNAKLDNTEWQYLGPLHHLLVLARSGDAKISALLRKLDRSGRDILRAICRAPPSD